MNVRFLTQLEAAAIAEALSQATELLEYWEMNSSEVFVDSAVYEDLAAAKEILEGLLSGEYECE